MATMVLVLVSVLGFCCIFAAVVVGDLVETNHNVEVTVQPLGGAIQSNILSGDVEFSLRLLRIQELTENGTVCDDGTFPHQFADFPAKTFQVEQPFQNASVQDVPVRHMEIQLNPVVGSATLTVRLSILRAAGNVSVGGEVYKGQAGDVLMALDLINWPFCGLGDMCPNDQVGHTLELTLGFTHNHNVTMLRDGGGSLGYIMVHSARFVMGRNVTLDGQTVNMLEGYPKAENATEGTNITISLPKFTDKVTYETFFDVHYDENAEKEADDTEPMAEEEKEKDDENEDGAGDVIRPSIVIVSLALFLAVL